MSQKKHILAIGAHIGDAEITAGLLLTKYAAAGHRASVIHMTAGEKGNPRMDAGEYRRQRIEEANAAAAKMGVSECIVLDHPDGELQADQATIHEMCDLVRRLRPDIVLTHWRGSFHRDHRLTYQIVMEGGFLAALPGIQRSEPAHLIRGLYYLENWEDLEDYQPDLWVDVSDVFDRWVEACRCHQLLRGEVSFGYLHYYTGLAAKRGAEVGVKYAVTVSLPPISRKRKVDFFPVDSEPVLIF
ncbi:MAG TPA: PIG-L family deacetylase [Phycisphaerae bacterium]|jgi:LmbE family N-acetylglucosaminyl deacetylase|nr:PIG-L family deacetylase [Phycisphaerae bacterium]HOB76025.1 PIG-L family deacetylase [Phycisphaerae bacterium]HOJ53474.1 PIG-L family deacetylase [Phycisphaerae bacterium]HOL25369.1 PIG-L family deacetylase [Phycisphaerae bacterium]HPP21873.1 PIG-L family deacetylase [Phycisphaerae bacterium]